MVFLKPKSIPFLAFGRRVLIEKDVFINQLIITAGFSDVYEYADEGGECVRRVG